jgi:hypothetical protein
MALLDYQYLKKKNDNIHFGEDGKKMDTAKRIRINEAGHGGTCL